MNDTRNFDQQRDFKDLDKRFTPFYESGERVEVVYKKGYENFIGYGCRTNGLVQRFYVGRSTGIKPIYLAIQNRKSSGGAGLMSAGIVSIKGLGIYK